MGTDTRHFTIEGELLRQVLIRAERPDKGADMSAKGMDSMEGSDERG